MTQDVWTRSVRGAVQAAARDVSVMWGWIVALGALWIWFGTFVLSHQVGSLVGVATLVGVALLFGGTLVGAWAICRGVNEIFAGFALREVNTQADRPGA